MKSFLIIFINFICILKYTWTHHIDCLREYSQQIIDINQYYANSLEACYDKDNINRLPPQDLNPEVELAKHKETSAETCFNLSNCNLNTDDANEFFRCHSKTASTNMHKFTLMHLNASSVAIEFNDQYVEEEKEILRCQLAAKRKNILDSYASYNEYLKCLTLFKQNYNESFSKVVNENQTFQSNL